MILGWTAVALVSAWIVLDFLEALIKAIKEEDTIEDFVDRGL